MEQTQSSLPTLPLFPPLAPSSSGWVLNTDGAGPTGPNGHAGWGVAIWSANEQGPSGPLPDVELFGPVPLAQWDDRWLGATVASNNTGELTAMAEALLWLDQEAPGNPAIPALIRYDPTYAFDVLTGRATATENTELVQNIQTILRSVSSKRCIEWSKVKGHSHDHGNDYADKLAEAGASGKQTTQWTRWHLPVGSPSPSDPLLTDFCWKRGLVYSGPSYARQLAGHEAYCSVPSAPPPSLPCRHNCGASFEWQWPTGKRKQAHHAREYRNKHEKICRGSDEATRTCPNCQKQFRANTTTDTILQHRQSCLPTYDTGVPPPTSNMWKSTKCKSKCRSNFRQEHERHCRGSVKENKTCAKCQAFFKPWMLVSNMKIFVVDLRS